MYLNDGTIFVFIKNKNILRLIYLFVGCQGGATLAWSESFAAGGIEQGFSTSGRWTKSSLQISLACPFYQKDELNKYMGKAQKQGWRSFVPQFYIFKLPFAIHELRTPGIQYRPLMWWGRGYMVFKKKSKNKTKQKSEGADFEFKEKLGCA